MNSIANRVDLVRKKTLICHILANSARKILSLLHNLLTEKRVASG